MSEQLLRSTRAGAPSGALAVPRAAGGAWEAPTLALAALIYGGWLLLTWSWRELPLALSLPLGAWLLAWHGSLQHEIIHDHPTPHRRLNTVLAWVPIALWLPYGVYRDVHRKHHREPWITDPVEDPESAYLTSAAWERLGPVGRSLRRFNLTLLGRLACGPFLTLATILSSEARRVARGDRRHLGTWLAHLAGAAVVAAWVSGVCGIPFWLYALGCVVPSIALTRLRAYAEHRWAEAPEHRTAVVEGSPILGLLFLFNNLHAVHHRWPTVPWYALPGLYRRERERVLKRNGGLLYRGYLDVFRRYLLTPHDDPVHPRHGATVAARAAEG